MKIHTRLFAASLLVLLFATAARADEHRVEVTTDGPPADELSEEIAAQLGTEGYRVIRGKKRTVCEIWLCKEWPVATEFEVTGEVNYPFKPGQLIGVVRFKRKGPDFRDQIVTRGVYTLRYGQQPVDGNHEGTSPTRDFLMLISAENDQAVAPADAETLVAQSADAAGSNHPAVLCLQSAAADGEVPGLRVDEDHEWTILQLRGKAKSGDTTSDLRVDIVVVGVAAE